MDTPAKNGEAVAIASVAIAVDLGLAGIASCGLVPCGIGYALQAAVLISLLTVGAPVPIAIVLAAAAGLLAPARTLRAIAWSPVAVALLFGILAALPHADVAAGFCRIDL